LLALVAAALALPLAPRFGAGCRGCRAAGGGPGHHHRCGRAARRRHCRGGCLGGVRAGGRCLRRSGTCGPV